MEERPRDCLPNCKCIVSSMNLSSIVLCRQLIRVFYSNRTMVTRPNEYGIEETVADLVPAPQELYSTQSAYVPPVLARWLRPHQREGVLFMVSGFE
jgi:hypothetical protein